MLARAFTVAAALAAAPVFACPDAPPRGTGDLGVVIERAIGRIQIVNTTRRARVAEVAGLGDLSHASVVYSRDGRTSN